MTELKRNEIVSRYRAGASIRRIARELGLARNTVSRVLAQIEARRAGGPEGSPIRKRPSRLDPYEPFIQQLLGRYPDLTAVRLLEELRQRGFTGGYTVVCQRLGASRPRSGPPPVVRFEAAPGAQAQMDYAVYDLDFTNEGPRLFVQLHPGLLATTAPSLRRDPRHDDNPPRTPAGIRASGGRGGHLLV
jgi:transposase